MVQLTMALKIHMYVVMLLKRQQQQKIGNKRKKSAVADSGCTGNCMAVSDHLNNVKPTTNIINAKCPNG